MTRHESIHGFNPLKIGASLVAKAADARRARDGVDPLDLRLAALEREIERRRRA